MQNVFITTTVLVLLQWPTTAAMPQAAETETFVSVERSGNATGDAIQPVSSAKSHTSSGLEQLQGIAKPKQDSELRAAAQGIVSKIHVQEGEWVSAGSPLVTLDDRVAIAAVAIAQQAAEARAALRGAELAMQQAASQLARTEIAFRANASSEFEVEAKRNQAEQARAAFERELEATRTAVAELQLAEAQLGTLTLSAPFDGQVLELRAKAGNTLDPTEVAVRMANLETLRVEMHLPLAMFGQVQANDTYSLFADAPVSREILATVHYVSPAVEPTSGTFRVVFEILNRELALPAGIEIWLQPRL